MDSYKEKQKPAKVIWILWKSMISVKKKKLQIIIDSKFLPYNKWGNGES